MAFDILWIMTRGGPGAATTVLSWLGYLTAFQFLDWRGGEPPLFPHGAEFPPGDRLFPGVQPTSQRPRASSASVRRASPALLRRAFAQRRPFRPPSELTEFGAHYLRRSLARSAAAASLCWPLVIFLWSALPVLALILMSLTPASDLIRTPPTLVPSTITLQNFQTVLLPGLAHSSRQACRRGGFRSRSFNSFVVGASVSVICVALGTFAGYAFARFGKARFFSASLWALLLTRMTPALTLVLPSSSATARFR